MGERGLAAALLIFELVTLALIVAYLAATHPVCVQKLPHSTKLRGGVWAIFVILAVLWLLGLVTTYTLGGAKRDAPHLAFCMFMCCST